MRRLQAADLRELGNVLQPLARDLVATADVRESGHLLHPPVFDVLAIRRL